MKQFIQNALFAVAFGYALTNSAFAAGSSMQVGAQTSQPVGHYHFCKQLPEECLSVAATSELPLTKKRWATITDINQRVNRSIEPFTDFEMHGEEEVWSYAGKSTSWQGDCEEYVLLKRKMLMEAGIPAGNLLITVVRQPNGDGHAVLTVVFAQGDLILDNLEQRILMWNQTGYQFLKRQSAQNAGRWVSIHHDIDPTPVASVILPTLGKIPPDRP